ncbi:MAG: hypothetical protein HQL26_05975 [Candidatus Omnitrophica bacterium]|nr:hypothetical protein [Candidatus Omnitrophota bacterium]
MFKKLSARNSDLFIFAALILCGLKFTFGMNRMMDLGMCDEAGYLVNGLAMLKTGAAGPQAGPLYSAWYCVLSLFIKNRMALYYFNQQILTILLPLAVYGISRIYKIALLPAALMAFFILIAQVNLDVYTKIYHFGTIIVLLSLGLAVIPKKFTSSLAIAVTGALLGAYIRPELFLSFLILLTFYITIFAVQIKTHQLKDYLILFAVIIFSLVMIKLCRGVPFHFSSEDRSFCAFGQHFSLNWVHWTHSNLNPWTNWYEIIQKNFGTAHNIKEAFLYNPGLFIKHVLANIPHTFKQIFKSFMVHANIILPPTVNTNAEAYILITTLFGYLIFLFNKKLIPLKNNFHQNTRPLLFIAAYLFTSFISILIIYPRTHYLLFTGIMLLIALGILLKPSHISDALPSKKTALIISAALFCVTPSSFFFYNKTKTLEKPTESTIHFIDALKINKPVNLLEAEGGLNFYLSDNYVDYPEYAKENNEEFFPFMKRLSINMVVVSEPLTLDSRFKNDKQFFDFISNPEKFGYTAYTLEKTSSLSKNTKQVLVKKDLLTPP